MSGLALGIWHDLRQRRLLPVALLLVVVAVALPLLALKPTEEPPASPAANAADPASQSVDGLPSPQQALSDKPLVSLAVLDEPSDLGEFESKNPFKPIEEVASTGASDDSAPSAPVAPTGGGDSQTATGQPSTPQPTNDKPAEPKAESPATPIQPKPQPKTEKKLTYALDLTIRGPKGLRSYRGLPKLSLLPAADNPLLVFLGIEDAGTKAVFLVDAKLKSVDGEGTCTPSPAQCATLSLAPGEEHVLANDDGQTWTIQIVEVRETSVAKAAKAARKAQRRQARKATTTAGDRPVPRFVPPLITDLFTGGRS